MKTVFKLILFLLLLFHISFSFYRHYYYALDGDMSSIILPSDAYKHVLKDPLGFSVLINNEFYPATNRFFAHFFMLVYFKTAPFFFQSFFSPLDSVYIASAFAKTLIQTALIFIIAAYITGKKKFWEFDFLLASVLMLPLFQIEGYNHSIGIIDHSVTYTFFYALALCLILFFFFPFVNRILEHNNSDFSKKKKYIWILLAFVISFNGPLNPAIIIIISSAILFYFFIKNFPDKSELNVSNIKSAIRNIPKGIFLVLLSTIIIALYSIYIGKNNSENSWTTLSLAERYARLKHGFYLEFTETRALQLITAMIFINLFFITVNKVAERKKIFKMLAWIVAFAIIYILILPFGGFRSYRPYIIRSDTFMPVTLSIIFYYGYTTFFIIKNTNIKSLIKIFYCIIILIFSFKFFLKDSKIVKENICERESLQKIIESPERIVFIDNGCWIMYWGRTLNPQDSKNNMELLQHWGVLNEKKLFYQKE